MTNKLHRRISKMALLFITSLLSCSVASAITLSRLDLSFLHRVKSSTLATAIRETLEGSEDGLDIDISSSFIGKNIKEILQLLKGTTKPLTLTARSNQWSQEEATMLLKAITNDKKNSKDKTAEDTTDPDDKSQEQELEDNNHLSILGLDLSWNDLSQENRESRIFLKSLQKIIEESSKSSESFVLRLDVCGLNPAACRAIGKGIMARYEESFSNADKIKPLSLHLTRNENVGDAGAAALAAAIRSVSSKNKGVEVFDVLNLSGCHIGDTGVEALAIALEEHPFCVRHLILSNNKISDEGLAALGRAFSSEQPGRLETLDLSYSKDIGDSGAEAIADILEKGTVDNIVLRSCQIQADGITTIAKSLKALDCSTWERQKAVNIDLSGNPLGILRKKKKSSAYSATALKSKASATTAAYVNLIGKTVQRGLKEIGLTEKPMGGTLESDDDEEARMDLVDQGTGGQDQSEIKCGALAFADAFIDLESIGDCEMEMPSNSNPCQVNLGLRHCSFDTRAAEAMAAVVTEAKRKMNMIINVDVKLNGVLEDGMIAALRGEREFEADLNEMAEQHLEAMEVLRIARKRAFEAAKAAATRMKAEAEMEAAWGAPVHMGVSDYDEDEWGYDAKYDDDDYF